MKPANWALLILVILFVGTIASAQDEQTTEIQGFFQTYRNFSYNSGLDAYSIPATKLNGGGFILSRNFAPWFAMWTQFSFLGSPEVDNLKLGIINNQQGLLFQTKEHGPFQFYAKGGIGFTHYSVQVVLDSSSATSYGDTALSLAYGGGAKIWASDHFGIVLDVSQVLMGVPNLLEADLPNREKWDSGIAYTTGLVIRF